MDYVTSINLTVQVTTFIVENNLYIGRVKQIYTAISSHTSFIFIYPESHMNSRCKNLCIWCVTLWSTWTSRTCSA